MILYVLVFREEMPLGLAYKLGNMLAPQYLFCDQAWS